MQINWNEVLPVVISIAIIIAIAVLKRYSDMLTAIVAVMPLNIPLGMWIFMSGTEPTTDDLANFMALLTINIVPTLLFLAAAWFVARQGGNVWLAMGAGYAVWGIGLALVLGIRGWLGAA